MNRAYVPTLIDELLAESVTIPALLKNLGVPSRAGCSGLNLYETDQAIVLEAPVPGIKPEDVKIFFDKGGVSIEAKAGEERKDVKYHLKSNASYSYWIPLPAGRVDEGATPEAICKDGILTVTFLKSRLSMPLKIAVKGA